MLLYLKRRLPVFLSYVFMIVGFMSVKADNGNSRLLSLTFNTLNNSMLLQNINCTIYYDSLVVGIIPNNTNISALRASFVAESVDSILVNNVAQQSGISINNYNNPPRNHHQKYD